ncbi:hypothetical protein GCM10010121_052110 [Streptomyces brasiliensis]|uniref:Zinc finger CGNR domain-containing protein n=1 Tax=Streptomyces brasiliensis TaxID=1954 RepID=A0A917KXD5_9ACTN|nr:hypothetical protein GCM10010121_052110 [Streptomyces brasiliensis]
MQQDDGGRLGVAGLAVEDLQAIDGAGAVVDCGRHLSNLLLRCFWLCIPVPGRLRACANPECRRFLLDRSRTNKGRWCSMAVCGNRMKARRHYERTRATAAE